MYVCVRRVCVSMCMCGCAGVCVSMCMCVHCVCMWMTWCVHMCVCIYMSMCVYNVHGDRHTCVCLPVVLYMLRTCMIFSPCHQTLVSAWALTAAASFVWQWGKDQSASVGLDIGSLTIGLPAFQMKVGCGCHLKGSSQLFGLIRVHNFVFTNCKHAWDCEF